MYDIEKTFRDAANHLRREYGRVTLFGASSLCEKFLRSGGYANEFIFDNDYAKKGSAMLLNMGDRL